MNQDVVDDDAHSQCPSTAQVFNYYATDYHRMLYIHRYVNGWMFYVCNCNLMQQNTIQFKCLSKIMPNLF